VGRGEFGIRPADAVASNFGELIGRQEPPKAVAGVFLLSRHETCHEKAIKCPKKEVYLD
jgi:hypothetical protein